MRHSNPYIDSVRIDRVLCAAALATAVVFAPVVPAYAEADPVPAPAPSPTQPVILPPIDSPPPIVTPPAFPVGVFTPPSPAPTDPPPQPPLVIPPPVERTWPAADDPDLLAANRWIAQHPSSGGFNVEWGANGEMFLSNFNQTGSGPIIYSTRGTQRASAVVSGSSGAQTSINMPRTVGIQYQITNSSPAPAQINFTWAEASHPISLSRVVQPHNTWIGFLDLPGMQDLAAPAPGVTVTAIPSIALGAQRNVDAVSFEATFINSPESPQSFPDFAVGAPDHF